MKLSNKTKLCGWVGGSGLWFSAVGDTCAMQADAKFVTAPPTVATLLKTDLDIVGTAGPESQRCEYDPQAARPGATPVQMKEVLADGTVREKRQPRAGEAVADAVARGAAEELNVDALTALPETQSEDVAVKSASGLASRYEVAVLDSTVAEGALEQTDFVTEHAGKTYFWVWRPRLALPAGKLIAPFARCLSALTSTRASAVCSAPRWSRSFPTSTSLIACLLLCASVNATTISVEQKGALEALYWAFGGPSWHTKANWMTGDPCSGGGDWFYGGDATIRQSWFGILCSPSGNDVDVMYALSRRPHRHSLPCTPNH